MSMIENLIGILMFKRQSMEKITNSSKSTPLAVVFIIINAIVASLPDIYRFIITNPSNTLPNTSVPIVKMTYVVRTLIIFFFVLAFAFSLAVSANIVLKIFDGVSTFNQCLKAVGFTEIFFLLGSLVNLILSIFEESLIGNIISLLSFLLFIIAFMMEMTSFSGLSNIKVAIIAFVSVILASILASIVVSIVVLVPAIWYSITNPIY